MMIEQSSGQVQKKIWHLVHVIYFYIIFARGVCIYDKLCLRRVIRQLLRVEVPFLAYCCLATSFFRILKVINPSNFNL